MYLYIRVLCILLVLSYVIVYYSTANFVGVVLCIYILQYCVSCCCCLMYLHITVLCILLVLSYVIIYYSIVYFAGVMLRNYFKL